MHSLDLLAPDMQNWVLLLHLHEGQIRQISFTEKFFTCNFGAGGILFFGAVYGELSSLVQIEYFGA